MVVGAGLLALGAGAAIGGIASGVGAAAVARCSRAVNQKVEPSPGVLRTPQVPSMSSMICLQMARPRPVPP